MAELLPDRLGITATPTAVSEQDGKHSCHHSKPPKRRQVTSILEWIQCFIIYTAVYTDKHPQKIKELFGYQALIVEARMEYDGETWLAYDRRFRQTVAATPDTVWAKIDPTLWNKAFTGQAKSKRCKYCFSLSHESTDCDWAPTKASASTPPPSPSPSQPVQTILASSLWNHTSMLCMEPQPRVDMPVSRMQVPTSMHLLCARPHGNQQNAQSYELFQTSSSIPFWPGTNQFIPAIPAI